MQIYQPAEDSRLLAEAVKRYAKGRVLDMGTGSGIQAETAMKSRRVVAVTAADINKDCKKSLSKKINFIHSDLFSSIPKQKFDTIIFNPPYLPQDRGVDDAAIYGGKKGYEVIGRFLNSCGGYLAGKGIILLLFSNLTKKGKIDEIIGNNCLEKEELSRKELPFFEVLYVYRVKKPPLLLQLEKKGVSGVKKFAEGNRGIVYTGNFNGRKVAIKARRKDSAAKGAIENEAKWLEKLNTRNIGPKLVFSGKDFFVCEFVEGEFVVDYLIRCSRRNAVAVIKRILEQCRALDELKVNKEEMLRPQRHVIVRNGRPVMIDFERCRRTVKPKNVTQFCQFLVGRRLAGLLESKDIKARREDILVAAKIYKNTQTTVNFSRIKDELQ